jgi:hypothetical protein
MRTAPSSDWSPLRSTTWTPLEAAAADRIRELCHSIVPSVPPPETVTGYHVDLDDFEYTVHPCWTKSSP